MALPTDGRHGAFLVVFLLVVPYSAAATPSEWAPAVSWEASAAALGAADLRAEVLAALDDSIRATVQVRSSEFVAALQPMFASTPKNEYGRLGHAGVRYTLNRYFIQRHAWFVNGIFAAPGEHLWNQSSVTGVLVQHVPPRARHAFERQLSGRGLDLEGMALLGVTIEAVILEGAVEDLEICYRMLGLPTERSIGVKELDRLMAARVALRVTDSANNPSMALQLQGNPRRALAMLEPLVFEVYPNWPATLAFLRQLREKTAPGQTSFDLQSVASFARHVEGRWARWSGDKECQSMKMKLLKLEEGQHSGCVRLSDFYERSMDPRDGWQFKESPDYLRQLGALDESSPDNPRVIIPNYVNAPGNCRAEGKYYRACCVSECEGLQLQIEQALQNPEPRPEEITAVVRGLSSATMPAGSVLSRALIRRIHEIARLHSGRVPVQSRLFAQWMHFAFPSECSFPHVAGSTNPVGPDIYSEDQLVKDRDAWGMINAGRALARGQINGTCTPWRLEEELFVPTIRPGMMTLGELEEDASVWVAMYVVGLLSAFALMVGRLLWGVWISAAQKRPSAVAMGQKPLCLV